MIVSSGFGALSAIDEVFPLTSPEAGAFGRWQPSRAELNEPRTPVSGKVNLREIVVIHPARGGSPGMAFRRVACRPLSAPI